MGTAYSVRLRNLRHFGEKTCRHIQVERREGGATVVGPFVTREHVWLDQWYSHCPEYSNLSVAAKLHILDFNLSWPPISIPLIWPSVKVSVNWDEPTRLLSPLACYCAGNFHPSQALSVPKQGGLLAGLLYEMGHSFSHLMHIVSPSAPHRSASRG